MNPIFRLTLSLSFFLPQLLFAQAFNELSTTLSLNNPAYHPDYRIHGKGYLSSDLKATTGIYFNTGYKNVLNQNFLRYQLGLGKWKLGLSAHNLSYMGQYNLDLSLSVGRDIAISRDFNIRVAAAGFQSGGYMDGIGQITKSYTAQLGIQANYKDWNFFTALSPNGINVGATQRFALDSTQKFITTIYFERSFGFQRLSANVIYQYRDFSLLLGGAWRSYVLGAGYQFENGHALMLSSKWERNLLSNGQQFNLQLGYHFALAHRPTIKQFTGTPSF